MEEIWKDITGYEGQYQVSSYGRVLSLPRKGSPRSNFLKGGLNDSGYPVVGLVKTKGSRPKTITTHTLVAKAFLVRPDGCTDVNHKDGIKSNNNIDNLEWVTHSDNLKHAFIIGIKNQFADNHHQRKLNSYQVKEICAKYKPRIYTRKTLAKEYNVSEAAIKAIISKRNWSTIW